MSSARGGRLNSRDRDVIEEDTEMLEQLRPFIGEWNLEVSLPAPDEVTARATFEWALDGRFLVQRVEISIPEAPNSIAIIGVDLRGGGLAQHYFDTRGVVRVYGMTIEDGVWTLRRDSPDFSELGFWQRYEGTFSADGNTIDGAWHMSKRRGRDVAARLRHRVPAGRLREPSRAAVVRGASRKELLLFDDHRLDGRGDVVGDLDDHHARPDGLDRLVEVDLALVELDAAGLADRIDDVLRGDGAEQAAVVAGLVRDREHRLVQELGVVAGLGGGLLERLVGLDLTALRGRDRALGGGLRELARDQVVAQVALRDVDDRPAAAQRLVVLEHDRLGHRPTP
jgi:hypothetical protein